MNELSSQFFSKYNKQLPSLNEKIKEEMLKKNVQKEKKDIDMLIQQLTEHPNQNDCDKNYYALGFKTYPYENSKDHYFLIENYQGRVYLYQSF